MTLFTDNVSRGGNSPIFNFRNTEQNIPKSGKKLEAKLKYMKTTELKKALLEFLEANNNFGLEKPEGIVDTYISTYKEDDHSLNDEKKYNVSDMKECWECAQQSIELYQRLNTNHLGIHLDVYPFEEFIWSYDLLLQDIKERIENSHKVKINEINLSTRTANCLGWLNTQCENKNHPYFYGRKKVYTLYDLLTYQSNELLKIPHFGEKCLSEIVHILDKHDLILGMCVDESNPK